MYKVDTDCRDVGLGIGVIGESKEKARLPYTGVADEEKLEEIIVSTLDLATQSQSALPSGRHGRIRSFDGTLPM